MANTKGTRTERIELRTQPEVKALIERAAELKHTTISAYLLNSAIEKARSDIDEADAFVLSETDRERFFSALSNPPAPNEALRSLFSGSRD
jgi:uncharacterized protein (DUF1778 family)